LTIQFSIFDITVTIIGKIYVHLKKDFPANKVKLSISGKEKCKWYEQKTRSVGEGDNQRFETYEVKHDKKRDIIDKDFIIHHYPRVNIEPGDYIFEFAIQLPKKCPSSTYYTGKEKSEAYIKYKLKAKFEADNGSKASDLKDDCFLVVRQSPDGVDMNLNAQESVDVKKCLCCCSMGTCIINTWFERNVYTTDEVAQAVVSVDNTRCKGIAKIVMQLKQIVELNAGHNHFRDTDIVLRKEFGMVQAGEKIENKNVMLNLKEIRAKVHWGNKSVDSDVEDMQDQMRQMAESIQPTASGSCLSIRYELETLIDFDGV
jgi:hypothetical protein